MIQASADRLASDAGRLIWIKLVERQQRLVSRAACVATRRRLRENTPPDLSWRRDYPARNQAWIARHPDRLDPGADPPVRADPRLEHCARGRPQSGLSTSRQDVRR